MKYIKISAAILVLTILILIFTGVLSNTISRAIIIFGLGVFGAVMSYIQFKRGSKIHGFIQAGLTVLMFIYMIEVLFFGG